MSNKKISDLSETKQMFFKVYQDINCMDGDYYVDTSYNVGLMLADLEKENNNEDGLFPVLEPILMTNAEFENLPEFTGY